MARRRDTNHSNHTASTRHTRRSSESYDSRSTTPSSIYDSPRPSTKGSISRAPRFQSSCNEDLSPITSLYPRSSVETYSSQASLDDLEDLAKEDEIETPVIPPLPLYRHDIEDVNVRASTPEDFAALFPSMNRLSIRHDDLTLDGNMNLRVDTIVSGRRKKTIQLFHLRMYDLGRREFSLRRYCRDSGREVCNSKRKYIDLSENHHPNIPRSVSTAMKSLTGRPALHRIPTSGSFTTRSRPGTSHSMAAPEEDIIAATSAQSSAHEHKPKPRLVPSNTIKLEFSNYARVDVKRRGRNVKKYEFEWWNHKYSWRRIVDKLTGTISFHLFRDGHNVPVAHMVPETRSPNQISVDEDAGGWIPPYHMWISDQSLIDVQTDVADVVVSTGLMALVDDCIKSRWHSDTKKRVRRFSLGDAVAESPRAFVRHLLQRRFSSNHQHQRPASPLRYEKGVSAC
ncbi:hypothetical protein F5Y16DRAFT_59073 [Xylariaceae sp. FL0255]|nr:hypothetical protein F5Y16DRAFT_59073 [Xylariaceae sp. FL0255]